MRLAFLTVFVAFIAAVGCLPASADEGGAKRVQDLIALHDLATSVAIGNYYLKQESLVSIRAYLAQRGRDEGLGDGWNDANPWWRQAEESLLERMMRNVDAEFSNLEWLKPQWAELYAKVFSEDEVAALIAHFQTDVGARQLQIIDHTISTHVMMTLSFSGKLEPLPGVEEERATMQSLWNDEDEQMRFSIEGTANADAQAFALSPLGKKYFTTVILNLTGIVNRRIGQVAVQSPAALVRFGGSEQRFLEGFMREPV